MYRAFASSWLNYTQKLYYTLYSFSNWISCSDRCTLIETTKITRMRNVSSLLTTTLVFQWYSPHVHQRDTILLDEFVSSSESSGFLLGFVLYVSYSSRQWSKLHQGLY